MDCIINHTSKPNGAGPPSRQSPDRCQYAEMADRTPTEELLQE